MLKIIALVFFCVVLLMVAMFLFFCIKCYKVMQPQYLGEIDFSVSNKRGRYIEEDCLITICEKCGKQFLTGKKLPSEKMPWHCTGCGNNLTWSFPYTRVQIESDDGMVMQAKNLIHIPGWVDDMRCMVSSELNGDVESVNVIIKKKVKAE